MIQSLYSENHKPEKSCEAGSNPMASGYAMNAKPGPDFTTSVTSIQFLFRCLNTRTRPGHGQNEFHDLGPAEILKFLEEHLL